MARATTLARGLDLIVLGDWTSPVRYAKAALCCRLAFRWLSTHCIVLTLVCVSCSSDNVSATELLVSHMRRNGTPTVDVFSKRIARLLHAIVGDIIAFISGAVCECLGADFLCGTVCFDPPSCLSHCRRSLIARVTRDNPAKTKRT